MILRISAGVASVALLVVACSSTPPPVPSPTTPGTLASPELNGTCDANLDCAGFTGAICARAAGVDRAKPGTCRLMCDGPTDARCAAPYGCLSTGLIDGKEHFSCERNCTGDTDCHLNEYSCQHVLGPTRPAFCVTAPDKSDTSEASDKSGTSDKSGKSDKKSDKPAKK